MGIQVQTPRIIMRDWEDGDLEHFARINSDPLVMEFYPERLDDKASENLVKNFQKHIDQKGYGFFALEHAETKAFMGFAGLARVPSDLPFAPAVELAWRLDYDYWGSGYASEIANALIEKAFGDYGLDQIVAYCMQDHGRAVHILEKLGFSEDKKGAFAYAPKRSKSRKHDYRLFRFKKV